MADSGDSDTPVAAPPPGIDPSVLIDALRAQGAERFDPVGFRSIEALARRASAHRDDTRPALDRSLTNALVKYRERFDRAAREARGTLARATARFPEAADTLRQQFDAGDLDGLRRMVVRLEAQRGRPLADLLAHIAQHTPEGATGGPAEIRGTVAETQGELKSLMYFRSTWSRLRADRRLSDAIAQAPENAGPLNAHFLVLQSLKLMREISPEYLEQFMAYADALLWLDQADSDRGRARKTVVGSERDKKRKSGRGTAN